MINFAIVTATAKHWPHATKRQARRQAVRLIRAKRYMESRGILAVKLGSEFKYEVATGSILK